MRTYEDDLDESAISTAMVALKELVEHGESDTLRRCWWLDYRRQPPTPAQILDDPAFLGNVSVYPFWREHILHVIDPANGINEHLMGGSLGIGKTYIASLEQYAKIVYLAHLRDPASYYGLARESRILIAVFSVTLNQTKNGYGDLRKFLQQSAYVQTQFPYNKRITQYVEFIRYPLEVIVGSQELSALGGNLYSMLLDEANFRLSRDPESARGAHKLYSALSRRIMSRFGGNYPGLLNLISSARDQSDFLERHLKEVKNNPRVHYTRGAIWDVKKPKSNRVFFVYQGSAYRKPHIVQKGDRGRYPPEELVSCPLDYYGAFRDDCDGSLRDLAGIPTFGSEKFIRNRESVKAMYLRAEREGLQHPFTDTTLTLGMKDKHEISDFTDENLFCVIKNGRWIPRRDPMCPRVLHIDTAFTQDGLGFAMGYVPGVVTVQRANLVADTATRLNVPSVIFDFVLRIVSPPNDEVPLFKIRNFIAWLSLHGYNIQRITADGYNSRDNSQLLREAGYNTEVVSVDKTDVPYMTLREALKEERILLYYHPIWDREILNLEYDVKKKKIDHPSGGNRDTSSKDVSDATAGVVFTLQDEKLWKAPDSAIASSSGPRPLTKPSTNVNVTRVGRVAGTRSVAGTMGGFHMSDYEG